MLYTGPKPTLQTYNSPVPGTNAVWLPSQQLLAESLDNLLSSASASYLLESDCKSALRGRAQACVDLPSFGCLRLEP